MKTKIPEHLADEIDDLLAIISRKGNHPEERHKLWNELIPSFCKMDEGFDYEVNSGYVVKLGAIKQ